MNIRIQLSALQAICSTIARRIAGGGTLMHCLLIIAFGLAIYANSFRAPFQFDDLPCIAENTALGRYFDVSVPEWQRHADMTDDIVNSMHLRPVTYCSFALNFRFHSLNVVGYHVVNLLIHLTTAVLVYLLMATILVTPFFQGDPAGRSFRHKLPLVVALLFLSHPIQTSAVTYIVQRFTSLATLFYLLSLLLYLRARTTGGERARIALLAGSVAIAVLGMFTKEIVFTLPVTALLCELLFLRGSPGTRMRFLAPLLGTMLIIPINTLANSDAVGGILNHLDDSINLANLTDVSQWEYFYTQFRVIVTYLRLLVLPINLHLDYDYPRYQTILAPPVLAAALFLVCIALSGFWAYLRSRTVSPAASQLRLFAFGVAWFFITISMSSSIIPLDDMIFEYRLYLPSTGFFLAVAALLLLARQRLESAGWLPGRVVTAGIMMVIVSLGVATYSRNNVWGNSVRFWEDNVAKAPNKARPHINLGAAYLNEHRLADSIAQSYEAIRLAPTESSKNTPWFNIGRCQAELKNLDAAIEAYDKALQANPYDTQTMMYYGSLLSTVGRYKESRAMFELAERINATE